MKPLRRLFAGAALAAALTAGITATAVADPTTDTAPTTPAGEDDTGWGTPPTDPTPTPTPTGPGARPADTAWG
ncbi:hypothetical protein [Streptomyces tendae]|uniref:hypothetical protein n=1 Tax=Streptomyces tendae TaxID=1932 RepID=UPI0038276DEA